MRPALLALLLLAFARCSIYDQYYAEARKIAEAMTLDQKIGQTLLADMQGFTENQITDPTEAAEAYIGAVFVGGNSAPSTNGNLAKLGGYLDEDNNKQVYLNATSKNWKLLTDRFKELGVEVTTKDNKKHQIGFLLGIDAIHGDQHTVGSVIFPHNIGLSCSHNEGHFLNLGFWTKEGVKKSGFNYVFAPCVATSHNPQWGRFYETMGQQDQFIQSYAAAFVKGLQDVSAGKIKGVLSTAKHFLGDGSTRYGADQGSSSVVNFKNFVNHNVQGYIGAVKEEVGSVMASYTAVNYVPNSFNSAYMLGLLRADLNFGGFILSNYNEVERASQMTAPRTFMKMTEEQGYAIMMNSGVDVFMISAQKDQLQRVIKEAKRAVSRGLIFEDRLTESVTRILQVKLSMNLVKSLSDPAPEDKSTSQSTRIFPESSSTNEYQDSLDAVHESLVVLKNSNLLPVKALSSETKFVVLVGEEIININRLTKVELFRNFDNIGMQCGGWTVRWQGYEGNDFWKGANKQNSHATSILDALLEVQKKNNFQIIYPNYTTFTNEYQIELERRKYIDDLKNARKSMNSRNTLIIGVFGEVPYAEAEGDVNIPFCRSGADRSACLYNPYINPYIPADQKNDLSVSFNKFESEVITEVRALDKSIPLVSVLLTGRPVPIRDIYEESTAVIAAWLPGTSGGKGVMDAIMGEYVVRKGGSSSQKNSLSVDWPRTQLEFDNFPIYGSDGEIPKISDIQFPVGYGLSTEGNSLLQQ